ncbi:MAG: hypothetical protein KAW17_07020 [Candidatus Eisenbacteria sp.]|nr:hypothetical protein [Candidatus Eisenbacteria bacterium]
MKKRNCSKLIRIAQGTRPQDATLQFMTNCVLHSRIETGLESNTEEYDEDVNVYLAHLLNSFINPRYYRAARKYITKYEMDIFARVEKAKDVRMKYTLYKTNADFLLLSASLFSNSDPGLHGSRSLLKQGKRAKVERGKTYYRFAFAYSEQITPRSPSLTEVLDKLSRGFEKYVRILTHLRGEYFNLHEHLSGGEEYHLRQSINATAEREKLRQKQNEFLDLFLAWKDNPDETVTQKLREVCGQLREMDPTFRFEPGG